MVDLKILKAHGVSAEDWKPLLVDLHSQTTHLYTPNITPATTQEEKLQRFHARIRSRVQAGVNYNLANHRTIYTLDLIWDTPFRQVSPTLLSSITHNCKTDEDALNALKTFGYDLAKLTEDLESKDAKTGQSKPKLNVPAFVHTVVPMVRAYMTARKARIINDHNLKPFIQLKSEINTPEQRAKAEIQSDANEQQAKEFNYVNSFDQAIHKMLLYSTGFLFPREEWYQEKQLRYKEGDSETSDTTEEYVLREGIRYHCPHPSRTYYDQAYPARSLNTDTGPRWVGNWKVVRFQEVKENEAFYNVDRIYPGKAEWWQSFERFVATVYASCQLNVPTYPSSPETVKDRESWLAYNFFYNDDLMDSSVVLCEHFERFIPKEEGLGDYEFPIWGRFVVAGDGTIVYGAPMGYTPTIVFKDNGDDSRLEEASQALLMTPYQDQVQNLLTQYLIAVRQNLANLTLVDENVIKKPMVEKIRNWGEKWFRVLNIFPADLKALSSFGQYNVNSALTSWRLPYLDTNGILQAIRTVLDLAERVLQFSSQEIGQPASHEQTQDEIQLIATSTDNLLRYTSVVVDQAIEAWAKQLYQARMNYASDDLYAQLPSDIIKTEDELRAMGFSVLERPAAPGEKYRVKIKKTAAKLLSFATVPPPYRRVTNTAMVRDLTVFFRDIMNNPMVAQSIGPDQALAVINAIAKLADLPMDGPLLNVGQTEQKNLAEAFQAHIEDVKQSFANIGQSLQRNNNNIAIIAQQLGLQIPNGNQQGSPQQTPG